MKACARKALCWPRLRPKARRHLATTMIDRIDPIVVIGCGLTPVKILFRLRLQKNYPRRNTTTTCKGTAHGLTYKMNVYIKFNKNIYISKIKIFISKKVIKKNTKYILYRKTFKKII
jgi:hypothetical protein